MARSKSTKDNFIYCGNLKCKHTDCARHDRNTPWNEVVKRDKFEPDKNGDCKEYVDY